MQDQDHARFRVQPKQERTERRNQNQQVFVKIFPVGKVARHIRGDRQNRDQIGDQIQNERDRVAGTLQKQP